MSTVARAKIAVPFFRRPTGRRGRFLSRRIGAGSSLGLGLGSAADARVMVLGSPLALSNISRSRSGSCCCRSFNYQLGIYPGYLLGPVERLRRRTLATLGGVWRPGRVGQHRRARSFVARRAAGDVRLRADAASSGRIAGAEDRWWLASVGGFRWSCWARDRTGRLVARTLLSEPQLGLVPIAFLDNRPDAWNQAMENVPVAGPLGLAQDFERRAEAAIVALADLETRRRRRACCRN